MRHPRVEVGLVTFVGDVLEHVLDRAPDHDLALDQRWRRHTHSLAFITTQPIGGSEHHTRERGSSCWLRKEIESCRPVGPQDSIADSYKARPEPRDDGSYAVTGIGAGGTESPVVPVGGSVPPMSSRNGG